MALGKLSAPLSAMVGGFVALALMVDDWPGFSLLVTGFIFGIVVGSCCYIFALCLAFLLCLLVPKSSAGVPNRVTWAFLVLAPILAGVVVYGTLDRIV